MMLSFYSIFFGAGLLESDSTVVSIPLPTVCIFLLLLRCIIFIGVVCSLLFSSRLVGQCHVVLGDFPCCCCVGVEWCDVTMQVVLVKPVLLKNGGLSSAWEYVKGAIHMGQRTVSVVTTGAAFHRAVWRSQTSAGVTRDEHTPPPLPPSPV